VVVEYWYAAPYMDRVTGTPAVLFAFDLDYDVRRGGDVSGRERWRGDRFGELETAHEQAAIRRAPVSWFLTERDREGAVRELGLRPERTAILPYGLDLDGDLASRRPEDPPEDPDRVVLFGSFAADFNRDAVEFTLESIWPEIRTRRPGTRLVVAGGGLPDALKARCGKAGVEVMGEVWRAREALLGAAVVLVPLRFAGGLRIRLLEALALERAVVGTALGVLGMGPERDRDVLAAESGEDLATAVVRALEDPGLRSALGKAGRSWVSSHHDMATAASRQRDLVRLAVAAYSPAV
jgi:glycosyltransferase involved in cell wall biosynthesis